MLFRSSNILLKLYLKSLKNGGKLQLDENIPYTAQMIATITRQKVGTVERALQIFMKLGPLSYTHLDVYKRQESRPAGADPRQAA